jgi:cell wall-associated NlpC family hydrolase
MVATSDAWTSTGIRTFDWAQVSHALLYLGGDWVAEAPGGGQRSKMTRIQQVIAEATLCVAYRYPRLTADLANRITAFAKMLLDRPYPSRSSLGKSQLRRIVGKGPSDGSIGTIICSQLLLQAYQNAGIRLTDVPYEQSTPGDLVVLHDEGKLDYVGHLKVGPNALRQSYLP